METKYDAIKYAKQMLNRFDLLESSLRADMNFLKWMNGLTLALVLGQYVRSWLA